MKTFILFLLLSLPALAKNDIPHGLFQVDSSQSIITLLDEDQDTSGFVDIRKEFRDSILRVESPDTFFESTEVEGNPEEFIIRGQFTHNGIKRLVQLKGKSFSIGNKVAWKLHNETIMIRIIAEKPSRGTTQLQKQVERIIQ